MLSSKHKTGDCNLWANRLVHKTYRCTMGLSDRLQDCPWYVPISSSIWEPLPSPVELKHRALLAIKQLNFDLNKARWFTNRFRS